MVSMSKLKNKSEGKTLCKIDFLTGCSDGLVMPFAVYCFVLLTMPALYSYVLLITISFTLTMAIIMGIARYWGEKAEIEHNHPNVGKETIKTESDKMLQMGIDSSTTNQMQNMMATEQVQWLQEIVDNKMGWEQYQKVRATASAYWLGIGYFVGGLLSILPFLFYNAHYIFVVMAILWCALCNTAFGWIKAEWLHQHKVLYYTGIQLGKLLLLLGCAITIYWLRNNMIAMV